MALESSQILSFSTVILGIPGFLLLEKFPQTPLKIFGFGIPVFFSGYTFGNPDFFTI